jgi:hypothetical protein
VSNPLIVSPSLLAMAHELGFAAVAFEPVRDKQTPTLGRVPAWVEARAALIAQTMRNRRWMR